MTELPTRPSAAEAKTRLAMPTATADQAVATIVRAREIDGESRSRSHRRVDAREIDRKYPSPWSAKRFYGGLPTEVTWRPVTAIPVAETDGNPATTPDVDWLPLVNTPSHPEYPAGHPSLNGAAATG
jgi:hypothetical protein